MIDLHVHLDGSLPPDAMFELALAQKKPLPAEDEAGLLPFVTATEATSLPEYLMKFDLPLSLLQQRGAIAFAAERFFRRLSGVLYAELRFAPCLHLQEGLTQRDAIEAALLGLDVATLSGALEGGLIVCMMRGKSDRTNEETLLLAEEYRHRGVKAVDLAGDEAAHPLAQYKELFQEARRRGLPFTIHAGEASGADSVSLALDLGASRIGHGVRAAEDPDVTARLVETKTPLELCPTSNLQTGAASSLAAHPLRTFLEKGVRATVNTDNTTVSATSIQGEYSRLVHEGGLGRAEVWTLLQNAVDASFLEPPRREALRAAVAARFDAFWNSL